MQVVEKSGIRIGRKRLDYIPAEANIRPLRDKIVVKPLPWEPSPYLKSIGAEIVWQGGVLRGTVLAVGPGTYWTKTNKDRNKAWQEKQLTRTEVKVGDVVELGGLELRGYDHWLTVQWGSDKVIIASEQDVTGVLEQAA
jgi:co-chaperonin GroES (HSP10)